MARSMPLLLAALVVGACAPAADEPELALADVTHDVHPAPESVIAASAPSVAGAKPVVHVWKTATCGCCEGWVEHLKAAGYPVEVEDVADINAVKRARGIPVRTWSCHTALVDGYLVEGHVPAATIDRVLTERPQVAGVAVPGMPMGSPGMEMPGMEADPYQVMSFTGQGELEVYEQH